MVVCTWPVLGYSTLTMSPIAQSFSSRNALATIIVSRAATAATASSLALSTNTCSIVFGSKAPRTCLSPSMTTRPNCIADTMLSSSYVVSSATKAGLIGAGSSGSVWFVDWNVRSAGKSSNTVSVIDAFVEDPNTEKKATRATPTINADAVDAVRRGFRFVFSFARRPDIPKRRGNGHPITSARGLAASGASTDTPVKAIAAPAATKTIARPTLAKSPTANSSTPNPVITVPAIARMRRLRRGVLAASSRIAATGGMRDAFLAGSNEESSVRIRPTSIETMIVRGSRTSAPGGTPNPSEFIKPRIPRAMRNPNAIPAIDPTTPMSSASVMTIERICLPVAPIARRRASSRVRWATTIRKVFWMMNAPTNIDTPAKDRRPMFKKLRPSLMSAACSFCSVSPVTASTPAGSTVEILSVRAWASTPASA